MNKDPAITLSEGGFSFGSHHIDWSNIREIVAFKLDLLTWDEIRFSFRVDRNPDWQWIEVSEEQEGFEDLTTELERQFPSVRGWQERVMRPAFSENRTRLFLADSSDKDS